MRLCLMIYNVLLSYTQCTLDYILLIVLALLMIANSTHNMYCSGCPVHTTCQIRYHVPYAIAIGLVESHIKYKCYTYIDALSGSARK